MGEHKATLKAHCERLGVSISQFIRPAILQALRDSASPSSPLDSANSAGANAASSPSERRLEFLLSDSEAESLVHRAHAAGHPSVRAYVAALVRAHMGKPVQLSPLEIQTVQASNARLVAIAQQLRHVPGRNADDLAGEVRAHVKSVNALILGNSERWTA